MEDWPLFSKKPLCSEGRKDEQIGCKEGNTSGDEDSFIGGDAKLTPFSSRSYAQLELTCCLRDPRVTAARRTPGPFMDRILLTPSSRNPKKML